MSIAAVPARFRNPPPPVIAPESNADHEEMVKEQYRRHLALVDENGTLKAQVRQYEVDLATMLHRAEHFEREHTTLKIQCRALQDAINELKVQLSVVATVAMAKVEESSAASRIMGETCVKAMEQANRAMLRAGIEDAPRSDETQKAIDDGAADLGRKLGAGFGNGANGQAAA
jgi:hypothetical protein